MPPRPPNLPPGTPRSAPRPLETAPGPHICRVDPHISAFCPTAPHPPPFPPPDLPRVAPQRSQGPPGLIRVPETAPGGHRKHFRGRLKALPGSAKGLHGPRICPRAAPIYPAAPKSSPGRHRSAPSRARIARDPQSRPRTPRNDTEPNRKLRPTSALAAVHCGAPRAHWPPSTGAGGRRRNSFARADQSGVRTPRAAEQRPIGRRPRGSRAPRAVGVVSLRRGGVA